MIRFAAMNDLEVMLAARKELQAEIDLLSNAAARKTPPGLKRPKNAPELDETKLKSLKLQLTALGMKITAEQAKSAKPSA